MKVCIFKSLRNKELSSLEVLSHVGALSIIEQLGVNYRVCEEDNLNELEKYDLLICPQSLSITSFVVEKLVEYVKKRRYYYNIRNFWRIKLL